MKQVDPALAHRVPPGQTLTAKWPVLTYGLTPRFDPARWTFRCFGLVEHETTWTWEEFLKLPRVTITSDIHCVTRWSKLDNVWEGVPVREIVSRVKPRPEATFVMQHADPDYTTNIALADLVDDDVLLAVKHNGRDLEPETAKRMVSENANARLVEVAGAGHTVPGDQPAVFRALVDEFLGS